MEHLDDIMAFEEGRMSEDEMLDFFQRIVNDGTVWRLQGFYGRIARQLLEVGAIEPAFFASDLNEANEEWVDHEAG